LTGRVEAVMSAAPAAEAFAPDSEVGDEIDDEEEAKQRDGGEGGPIQRSREGEGLKEAVVLWRWGAGRGLGG
jgi:hypothetical protein